LDLVAIAQIITGTATLIVALVLVYQLRQQHKDSDIQLSMDAIKLMQTQFYLGMDNIEFRKIYSKREEGLEFYNNEELGMMKDYFQFQYVRINTEWRLGRLSKNPEYYRVNYLSIMNSKSGMDYYKLFGRTLIINTNFGDSKILEYADKVYEELSGEKIGDSNE
tara:strand:- start:187 stop:678 length:492 start_codon:yes stop_codon:yes gene_type:complete